MASIAMSSPSSSNFVSKWSARYRGATVQDLDPPAALSLTPTDTISDALLMAFERDYTHLTIISSSNRALLGYISIPRLQEVVSAGQAQAEDPLSQVMTRFQRVRTPEAGQSSQPITTYKVITLETPLEELEAFFEGEGTNEKQNFAVITDEKRKFVLGVATVEDLHRFVERRPE